MDDTLSKLVINKSLHHYFFLLKSMNFFFYINKVYVKKHTMKDFKKKKGWVIDLRIVQEPSSK